MAEHTRHRGRTRTGAADGRHAGETPDSIDGDDGEALGALVDRGRAGDTHAICDLISHCEPMVRAIARRHLRGSQDVDDVVQETWLTFAEHLHRIERPAAVRGWLARVATRAAWRQAAKRRQALPTDDLGDRAGDDDTEVAALAPVRRAEVLRSLGEALGGLRVEDRRLLEMISADDRPDYRKVATALGRPIGSIGPTRQRALSRLRRDSRLRVLAE